MGWDIFAAGTLKDLNDKKALDKKLNHFHGMLLLVQQPHQRFASSKIFSSWQPGIGTPPPWAKPVFNSSISTNCAELFKNRSKICRTWPLPSDGATRQLQSQQTDKHLCRDHAPSLKYYIFFQLLTQFKQKGPYFGTNLVSFISM